eukprot:11206624-Lingulodinium_polyedra.AAC.1
MAPSATLGGSPNPSSSDAARAKRLRRGRATERWTPGVPRARPAERGRGPAEEESPREPPFGVRGLLFGQRRERAR